MAQIKINTDSLKTGQKWTRHKIQDGNNVFRILPPYGDMEVHNNYPYRRWVVAWLIDPKLNKRMPFASPFSTGGKDTKCPVHEYSKALSEKIDNLKQSMKAKGVSDAIIKDKLGPLNKIAWEIKLQKTFAYNACDKAGKIGLLEIKKTAHDGMKAEMLKYIEKFSMDPTSLSSDIKSDAGVWFNISRAGSGKDTKYSVEMNKRASKDSDGETVYKLDRSALPEEVVEGYSTQGYDLSTVYKQKSYDELKEILLYNIALIAEEVPQAANIPGFEVDGEVSVSSDESEEVEDEAPVSKPSTIVALALDDDDDDDDDDLEVAQPVKSSPAKSNDDFMAMADSILGD